MTRSKSLPLVGDIDCPKKGLMALKRCVTARVIAVKANDKDCRCGVLSSHRGRYAADAEVARVLKSEPGEPDATEGETMATHAHSRKNCSRCHKPSAPGSRLKRGVCKKCRDTEKTAGAAEAPQDSGQPGAEGGPLVCRVPTPAEQARFMEEFPQYVAPMLSAAPKRAQRAHALDRQLVAPAIAAGELRDLQAENEGLRRTIADLQWAVDSYLAGRLTRSELARKTKSSCSAIDPSDAAVAS